MNICVVGTGMWFSDRCCFCGLGNEVVCMIVIRKNENLKKVDADLWPGLRSWLIATIMTNVLYFQMTWTFGKEIRCYFYCGGNLQAKWRNGLVHSWGSGNRDRKVDGSYKVIVTRARFPVVLEILWRNNRANKKHKVNFDVVRNPEFLREGSAIADTLYPDPYRYRSSFADVAMTLLELYAVLERQCLSLMSDARNDIKYASNAFLATKISFINSIADICEKANAIVIQVAKGMGSDSRIGPHSWPGSRLWRIMFSERFFFGLSPPPQNWESSSRLLDAVIEINMKRSKQFVERIKSNAGPLKNKL